MKKLTTMENAKELGVDLAYDVVGCMIYSAGVQTLSAPNNTPPGGVTGIAILINYLTGLPISIGSFLVNLPLLVLAFLFLGKQFTWKTLKSVIVLSLSLEFALHIVTPYSGGDMMLSSLFAGVIQGTGLAIIFMRGSTTGGTDILSKLFQLKLPHLPMGRLLFVIDALVLLFAAVVYKNISNSMYALVIVFVSSQVIDSILFGLDRGRMLLIISENHDEIAREVHEEMGRGSTLLSGTGTYTGEERPVLMCAVGIREFYAVKKIVHFHDPDAFIMTVETDEVLGEGFKPLHFD